MAEYKDWCPMVFLALLLVVMLRHRPVSKILERTWAHKTRMGGTGESEPAGVSYFWPLGAVVCLLVAANTCLYLGWAKMRTLQQAAKLQNDKVFQQLIKGHQELRSELVAQVAQIRAISQNTQADVDHIAAQLHALNSNVWLAVQYGQPENDTSCTIQVPGQATSKFDLCTDSGRSQWKAYVQAQMLLPRLCYKDIVKHDANNKPYLRVVVNGRGWVSVRQLEQEEQEYGADAEVVGRTRTSPKCASS